MSQAVEAPAGELVGASTSLDRDTRENRAPLALTREVISTDRAAARTYDAISRIIARVELEAWEAWRAGIGGESFARAEALDRKAAAWKRRRENLLRCTAGDQGAFCFRCFGCGGRKLGQPMGCNARWCPLCCRKLRESNIAHVKELMRAVDERRKFSARAPARWRFVTLTVRSQRDLLQMRKFVAECWSKLTRRKWWRDNVRACITAFEVTHTAAGWHVHIHALVDAFVPRTWLVKTWERITCGEGLDAGQHVSEPKGTREAIARELSKYVGKDLGGHFAENPGAFGVAGSEERLAEFIQATERFRALRSYGDAYYAAEVSERCGVLCEECKQPMEFERVVWMSPEQLTNARKAQRGRRASDPATAPP